MKRNVNLDFIKIIACFSVLILHASNKSLSEINFFFYCFGVFGIPLFFMVDGALLLNKESVNFEYSFCKIVKLLRFCILWFIVYCIYNFCINQKVDLKALINGFFARGDLAYFWFMGVLLFLYLCLPLLHKLFNNIKMYRIFMGFLVTINVLMYFLLVNMKHYGLESIPFTCRVYEWIIYFMLGGILFKKREETTSVPQKARSALTTLCFAGGGMYTYCLLKLTGLTLATSQYNSPIIMLLAAYIFYNLIRINVTDYTIISDISKSTLFIYMIHRIYVIRLVSIFAQNNIFLWMLAPISVFFISFVLCKLAGKIKIIQYFTKL